MKIFLSYRFTGEDAEVLKKILKKIGESLKKAGHEHFCSFWESEFFEKNNFSNEQIMNYALRELDDSDACLAFIKSNDKSEGMLLEAGYALAKGKRFYLAIKKGVSVTFMKELAGKVIEFETLEELYEKLSRLG